MRIAEYVGIAIFGLLVIEVLAIAVLFAIGSLMRRSHLRRMRKQPYQREIDLTSSSSETRW